jgi:putative Holliday junction resolvase
MILGLDVGDKRVGVAVARRPSLIPTQLCTLPRKEAEKEILRIVKEEGVDTIVIGVPLSESNSDTEQALSIRRFAARLFKRSHVKIEFVDEYNSSAEAGERLKIAGGSIDAISAQIILERYLNE